MNFELSEADSDDPESRDINNKKFWEKINKSFETALELLDEEAERLGIDLDNLVDDETEKAHNKAFEESEKHPLVASARNYADKADRWFEENEDLIQFKAKEFQESISLDLPKDNPIERAFELQDVIEIIRWYQYLISAKLFRAVSGKYNYHDFEGDPVQNDSNGSAKIALISIERSISAWARMYNQFPESEDKILELLVNLKQLFKVAEKEFPQVYKFIRPGFDE